MAEPASKIQSRRNFIIVAGLVVLGIYVIVPQLGSFHASWGAVKRADSGWIGVAAAFTFLTYLFAAGTYYLLAAKALRYSQLVLVQLAAMFVNKLLPAGVGALGANYAYLRHRRYNLGQAAATVAVNNLLGVVGHLLVVLVSILFFTGHIKPSGFWQQFSWSKLSLGAAVILLALAILVRVVGKEWFGNAMRAVGEQLASYKQRRLALLGALGTSICLTLCNLLCLGACALALNIHLPFVALVVIFSLGVGGGSAAPTPGGLGGFEGGLFAGALAYHSPAASALALALLYRLVSYWLPLIGGALAFAVSQKRKLFTA